MKKPYIKPLSEMIRVGSGDILEGDVAIIGDSQNHEEVPIINNRWAEPASKSEWPNGFTSADLWEESD